MSHENGQATAYKPRSGSSAEAAMHHLAAHGPMLATEMADAIDVESKAIHAGLGTAVQYDAINQWLACGGPMGAGQAAAAGPAGRQRIPTQSAQTLFALWSDGRLQIEREGSDPLVLSTDDTRALVAYLERMAEAAA